MRFLLLVATMLVIVCSGKPGPTGPVGPIGPKGLDGVDGQNATESIAQYTGVLTSGKYDFTSSAWKILITIPDGAGVLVYVRQNSNTVWMEVSSLDGLLNSWVSYGSDRVMIHDETQEFANFGYKILIVESF